jgi:RHS repeat-associated protein
MLAEKSTSFLAPRVRRRKVTVRYTNIGGMTVKENRDGVKRGYVPDPQGNTIALVDENGAITDEWEYSVYGEVESHTGSSETPFTWNGAHGYYTDPTGLTYVRARYYNAPNGQWQTMDPLWPSAEAYIYARNSPVVVVDPSGLRPIQGVPQELKELYDRIADSFRINYGRYCGLQNPIPECRINKEPDKRPTDCLDACCRNHDWAWWQYKCATDLLSEECRRANYRICLCAQNVDCNTDTPPDNRFNCQAYRAKVLAFCAWPKPKDKTLPPITGGPKPDYPSGGCKAGTEKGGN